ncbi:MAG: sigma-54-dependent Fis family transcriptional regulator [Planctomycetes bacterium]|nr:sigma-54-dependent Fis family transcriptional regulator [Planctomycetota bacterium]
MLSRILLALDDPALLRRLRRALVLPDVLVEVLNARSEIVAELGRHSGDLLLVSRSLLPEPAAASIQAMRSLPEVPDVVVLTRAEDAEDRARLLAAGAQSVLFAHLSPPTLREVLTAILARREQLEARGERSLGLTPRLSDFVTASPAMQSFMGLVLRVVDSDASLLILGETGVGKEHLARAIHAEGPRAGGPFVSVNCGALTETLLESELFGHEEGAFTGATRPRRGCFEMAHRGTLFLDEIAELPAHLQSKLLHVLQRREIQRLGSESKIAVDVRVCAATNRDIGEEVRARRFRNDLYYRLSVVTLAIPPLRARREDIGALAEAYVEYYRQHIRRDVRRVSPEAIEALLAYPWPGNVRELVNLVERAMLLCNGEEITLADLPEGLRTPVAGETSPIAAPGATFGLGDPSSWTREPLVEVRRRAVEAIERAYLAELLAQNRGRIGRTAAQAGIQPRSLFEKLRRYHLRKEDFRGPTEPPGPALLPRPPAAAREGDRAVTPPRPRATGSPPAALLKE